MLFYLILTTPLAEVFFIFLSNITFRIQHNVDKNNVIKGDVVIYNLSLINPSLLLFCPMIIYFEDGSNYNLLLYPRSSNKIERKIELIHRGNYDIGITKIKIIGFLGLFYYNYMDVEYERVLVYPKIYSLKSIHFNYLLKDTTNSVNSFNKIHQSLYSDLREYLPGDNFNRIHWKLSSRQDRLITKLYHGENNYKVKIFINNSEIDRDKNLFLKDNIIESAVSISRYLLENNNNLDMYWYHNENKRNYGESILDFDKFYKSLALIRFENSDNNFNKLLIHGTDMVFEKSILIIFTNNINPELYKTILLKQKEGFMVHIITPKNNYDLDINLYGLMDQGIKVFFSSFIGEYNIMDNPL